MKVHAFILEKKVWNNPMPVIAPPEVESDMRRIRERYAQCGVEVRHAITTMGSIPGVSMEPRVGGSDPFDGPYEYWEESSVGGTTVKTLRVGMPDEARAAVDALTGLKGQDEIGIVYVYDLQPNSPKGATAVPGFLAASASAYAGWIFVDADRRFPFTAAHEILHVLLAKTHTPPDDETKHKRMLFFGAVQLNDAPDASVLGPKRISKHTHSQQYFVIRTHPMVRSVEE